MMWIILYLLGGIATSALLIWEQGYLELREVPLLIVVLALWPLLLISEADARYKAYEREHGKIYLWKREDK